MWIFIVAIVIIFGLAAACNDDSTPSPEENSDLIACYNLAKQMAEEGHRRDKQWLDDQLDYCDRTYG